MSVVEFLNTVATQKVLSNKQREEAEAARKRV
jgi:hypothetical protein